MSGRRSKSLVDSTSVMSRGEINHKTGAVLTEEEVLSSRRSKGMCITCGEVKTHEKRFKITGPKMIPLNVQGLVVNGQCLKCLKESFPNPGSSVVNGATIKRVPKAKLAAVAKMVQMQNRAAAGSAATSVGTGSSNAGDSRQTPSNMNVNVRTLTGGGGSSSNINNSNRNIDAIHRSDSMGRNDSPSPGDRRQNYGNGEGHQTLSSSTLNTFTSTLKTDFEEESTSLNSSNYYTSNNNMNSINNTNNNSSGRYLSSVPQSSTISTSSNTDRSPPLSGFDLVSVSRQASDKWRSQVGKPQDFTAILEFMRKNPEEDAIIKSFKEMGRLASSEENKDRSFKEMPKLIKSMQVVEFRRHNAKLVAQACQTLCHFANTSNEDKKKRIGVFGGVACVLSFMNAQPSDASTQDWGSHALALLAAEETNRDIIVKAGGVDTLLNVVGHSQMTPEAVEWAIRAVDICSVQRGKMDPERAADVVTAVANCVQHHRENKRVVRWGVRTLNAIWEIPGRAGIKAFRPTVRIITNAIKHHEEEIPLQTDALELLVKMARSPDSAMGRLVAPKGLVEHMHVLLGLNEDNTLHDRFENRADLFTTLHERTVQLFYEMLQNDSIGQSDMAHYQQCADSIGQLMYTYLCSSDMARAAASIILCVRIMEKVNIMNPSKDPNFVILELIMGVFLNHADVNIAVLNALHNSLVRSEAHASLVADANLILALREAVDRHSDDDRLLKAALSALETIGGYASASAALDASDVASTVVNVLEEYCQTEDDAGATAAFSALRAVLVGDGDGKCDNFTENFLKIVCRTMKTFPKDAMLQFDGCLILRGCLSEDNISMFQCNEDVSEVLFKACEVSEECMKTSNMTIQILFEY